jgi:hypothetical protein
MLYMLMKTYCSHSTTALLSLSQSLPKQTLISYKTNLSLLNHVLCRRHKSEQSTPIKEVKSIKPDTPVSSRSANSIPYKSLSIGVLKEVWANERRVALTPAAVQALTKKGIAVNVEKDAGVGAKFLNTDYESSGAKIVDKTSAYNCDVVLKVRQPTDQELPLFRPNTTLISFLFPAQNKLIIDALSAKSMNLFAMDCVPRISRAQVFDALSSMANIAGYLIVNVINNN